MNLKNNMVIGRISLGDGFIVEGCAMGDEAVSGSRDVSFAGLELIGLSDGSEICTWV